uniref:Putative disease resistance protein RPM1 n=1 Tax=Davidia involucrata TaxID=16924 RepID=A0A5B6ZB38_DAVIN
MAEIAVGFVIDKLIPLFVEEAKLLKDVRKEVDSIKAELEIIQPILRNADERADEEETDPKLRAELEMLRAWVKQVRQVAYRIEDVIENYILHLAQHPQPQQPRCTNFIHRFACLGGKLKPRHEIASEIQDINTSLEQMKKRYGSYGFNVLESLSSVHASTSTDGTRYDPRLVSLYQEEDEIVGIESSRDELIGWLVGETSKRVVISLVGMGGLGKTTLAKKVYDNQTTQYDCHAWITVSQSYQKGELLRTMIKQFYQSTKESLPQGMEEMSLTHKLREYLQQKRYLVVFDDVWEKEFWEFIKDCLPDDKKGSRVIITTRNYNTALFFKTSSIDRILKLQPLSEEKAWQLFCKKAFLSDCEGDCPSELEELSRDIVRKCEGLPLAIVAIGGLLSTKEKVLSQWQKLHASLGSRLHLTSITKILSLSYHDLPYHLKSCFLYFGMIPEDYSIRCVRLIRLWIAENFVKEDKDMTLEDVAEEYLTELIQRNLVQASWVDFDRKVRSCRVHDLMREIILRKSQELRFCQVLAHGDSSCDGQTRRLSIHSNTGIVSESISDLRIRSLFLFGVDEFPESLLHMFIASFKLLKILDFEDASLDCLPEEVGNLLHLRYLSVRNTRVKMLPKSIEKLHNLQTLDLKNSLVQELPIQINKLYKLRHLLAYNFDATTELNVNSTRGVKIHEGFRCLEDLQKLCFVEGNHGVSLIRELRYLWQLRRLGITKLTRDKGSALCASVEEMQHLESLSVSALTRDEIIDIQHISSPPQLLRRLYLKGRLEKLPTWISSLQHLVRIRLSWSGMTDDPLKVLQLLPNLLELGLQQAYDGEQLHFEAGGFQKLKVLSLEELNRLSLVIIDKKALPLLEQLRIGPIPQLKEMPAGIHHLQNLTTLQFIDMRNEFRDRVLPDKGGQEYWIIEHIPLVQFCVLRGAIFYATHTLMRQIPTL